MDADDGGGGGGGGGAVVAAGMDDAFLSSRWNRWCCFWGPWASSSYAPRSSRVGGCRVVAEGGGGVVASCRGEGEVVGGARRWWWRRSVDVLMKVREWSELVAGPRWKTFLRRFRRSTRHHGADSGRLNYDPLSYALNFDEGHGSCRLEDDYDGYYCDFSTRFARCRSLVINNVQPA
ncbi:hypothetical protein GUJ93_ZPchr0006g46142 [Zizania palustris]|uniref:Uncharacterized protein n=1 Tax=Zizania palustris TaxID=103762 RepID=A0A8J5SH93_ZIZPA|nr:hypothetical protein GUJ93_ZPchr0006g46142 [Zizania palustris]